MFGNSYFGVRYWGDRYWGGGAQAVQPQLGGTSGIRRRKSKYRPYYRELRERDLIPPQPEVEIPVHLLEQLIEQHNNRIAQAAQDEEDAILLLLLAA